MSYTVLMLLTSFSTAASTVTITSSDATNWPSVICRSTTSDVPRMSSPAVITTLKTIIVQACCTSTPKCFRR